MNLNHWCRQVARSLEVAHGQKLEAQVDYQYVVERVKTKRKKFSFEQKLHREANRRTCFWTKTQWERKTIIATTIATISLFSAFLVPPCVRQNIPSGARALSTLCRIELIGEGLRSFVCLSVVPEDQKPVVYL
jgi:hypothetical protein